MMLDISSTGAMVPCQTGFRDLDGGSKHHTSNKNLSTSFSTFVLHFVHFAKLEAPLRASDRPSMQVFFADGLLDYVRSTRFQNGVDPRDLVMYWAYCAS
jgi:hypothetical protein